jgi:5-methylcytosine-specific restriction enzyme subunit McrC
MIFTLSMPDEQGTGKRFSEFVRDDQRMWKVFQAFVFNFYKKRQATYKVSADAFPWQQSEAHHEVLLGLPRLETDIVLSSRGTKWLIDTKFYSKPFPMSHGKRRLIPEHINQIFAYMQNLDSKNRWQDSLTGVLLYAAIGEGFRLEWTLFGRPLIIAAVDLTKPWFEIEEQLLTLIGLSRSVSPAPS